MTLPAGTRVGPYEVRAALGAGGMGEVYRARDTRLQRDVALKTLPPSVAGDPARLARFEREARVLASLNHPNVGAIYGLEEAGGQPLLVLELVEGEDLADRVRRGAIPVREALALARQIAQALEAAHERGIVHRDLKPANVKVRPDGTVKVLDFGLAKAYDASPAGGSTSPTLTYAGTQAGIILGTAAYMAPEQARGQVVDKRADVWAFGVLLWEMLTGSRLFGGDTTSDVLAAVLTLTPDWTALPDPLPPAVRHLLRRTLQRNPKDRLHDIADARLLIDDALADEPDRQAERTVAKGTRTRAWLPWLAIPLVAAAALAAGRLTAPESPQPRVRLSIALPPGEQVTSVPAISRDGRLLAYTAGRSQATARLYVRALDDFTARVVDGSAGAVHPFLSPDGRDVAFFADGKLRRAPVGGGGAVDIAPAPGPWGGTWGADGRIVYVPAFTAGLWRVSADGGTPERLTRPDSAGSGYAHVFPQLTPNGRDVLFGFWGRSFYTALHSLDTPATREVTLPMPTQELFVGVYMASGHLLAGDVAGGVRAVAWTPATTGPVSPETVVFDDVYWRLQIERSWMNVADNGTIVYVPGDPSRRHLVWVDRQGREEQLPGEPDQILRATVSRDGRRVAYDTNRSTQWVVDLATGARSRIVSGIRSWHGGWLPGDDRLVVSSNKGGNWDLYTIGTTGNDAFTPMHQSPYSKFVMSVGPDGTVVYGEDHPETGMDLWRLTPDGRARPLVVTRYNEMGASLSADGRFVAYTSDETGRPEVYAIAASGDGPRIALTTEGGTAPLWARSGRELFYRSGNDLMSVDVQTQGSLVVGARRRIMDVSAYDAGEFREFDASADGQRFLFIRTEPASRPTRLNVMLDGLDAVRARIDAQ